MARLRKPVNKQAVEKADAAFYKRHPERKGKPLTSTPRDALLRAEWIELYKLNGGMVAPRPQRGSHKITLAKCMKSEKPLLEVYVYVVEMAGEDPYGHVGLVIQQQDGSYIRYSQAARNPNLQGANRWEYFFWQQEAVVRTKKFLKGTVPKKLSAGGKIIRIPTENPDKIQKAVDKYIADDNYYHAITNNCADFVNDTINESDDVSLWDSTIPKDYFKKLAEDYPDCVMAD